MIRVLHPDHLGFVVRAQITASKFAGEHVYQDAFGMRFIVVSRVTGDRA